MKVIEVKYRLNILHVSLIYLIFTMIKLSSRQTIFTIFIDFFPVLRTLCDYDKETLLDLGVPRVPGRKSIVFYDTT